MDQSNSNNVIPALTSKLDSSEHINQLCAALSKAQGEFPTIPKDSEVTVKSREGKFLYTYKYADLTTIISHTRPVMNKHGLSFTQDYIKHSVLGTGLITILFHESGEYLKSGFVPCNIGNSDMKIVAGIFTYGKRISLTAALGISADEDVDAGSIEGDSGNSTEKKSTRPKEKPPVKNFAPGASDNHWSPEDPAEPPMTLLDELLHLVKIKEINPQDMKGYIKMTLGEYKPAKELSDVELRKVIKFVSMK